jgi:hypothetical protein
VKKVRNRKPAPRRKPIKQEAKERRLAAQHAFARQQAENRASRLRDEAHDRAADARLTQEQLEEYRRLSAEEWPEESPEDTRLSELIDLRDQVTEEEIEAQLAALRGEPQQEGPAPSEPSRKAG